MKKRTTIIISLFALTCQVSASTILWDASHGEYGYVPNRWFSALSNHLAGYEFEIDTTYKGFLVDDPAPYDIAVVCVGSSCYSAYTTEEAEKIKDFVVNGGSLLIMGEMDSHNDNIQPVASAFGITLGVSKIGSYPYAIYTSDFAPHPLFDGIDEICFQSVGELSTSSNLEEVAWYEGTDKALVVAGEYGYGRVVALGDINIFSSFNGTGGYYYRADNRRFSVNTFEYLVPEPTPIKVAVDIKPQSCPNPLNVKSKGVLPVAILGTEDVDVNTIDIASVRLAGVAPIRSSYEDVAAPVLDANECACIEDGPDGYIDLTLKFDTQAIVEALGEVIDGEEWILQLTGVLHDDTPIEGEDCILVFSCEGTATKSEYGSNSPYTLNVTEAIDGNTATGEYNIEFHSAPWQSYGYHIFSGDWNVVTLTAGDFEPDGDVDFVDFTFFAARWRDSNCGDSNDCDGTDFDYSGTVDWSDLGVFTQNWLKGVSGIEYEISPCNMDLSAAERSGQTRFSVTVQGSYIHFEDMMVANCCPDELWLEMTLEDNLITIYEHEYLTMPCFCICDYPVTATLGPFEPGTYTLEVYEDSGGFIGSTTVTIE